MRILHVLAAAVLLTASFAAHADTFEYKFVTPGSGVIAADPVSFDVLTTGPAAFNTVLPALECHYEPYGNCDGIYIDHKTFPDQLDPTVTDSSDTIAYVFGSDIDYEGALFFLTDQDLTVGVHQVPYSSGTLTVTRFATTPEPLSIALFGTGLFGVTGVVKRRFA